MTPLEVTERLLRQPPPYTRGLVVNLRASPPKSANVRAERSKGINPMIERHTRWITVFRKTNGTEERLGRHRCETPMDVRTALTLSAAHVFDFPQENGPVLKGDFVETIVAQGDADGSMFGVVGIRPCRDGEWDIGEHEGCGKDTERAVRRYA